MSNVRANYHTGRRVFTLVYARANHRTRSGHPVNPSFPRELVGMRLADSEKIGFFFEKFSVSEVAGKKSTFRRKISDSCRGRWEKIVENRRQRESTREHSEGYSGATGV